MKEEIVNQLNIKEYKGWQYSTLNEEAEKKLMAYIDKYGSLDRILGGDSENKTTRFFADVTYICAPENIKKVEPYAFANCTHLIIASLNSCYEIGEHAFYRCKHLSTATLSSTTIVRTGAFAFAGNSDPNSVGLSVYAPSLEFVSPLAFFKSGVQFLRLPSVEVLNENSICQCNRLEVLNLPETRRIAPKAIISNKILQEVYAPKTKIISLESISKCPELQLLVLDRMGKQELRKDAKNHSTSFPYASDFCLLTPPELAEKEFHENKKACRTLKK